MQKAELQPRLEFDVGEMVGMSVDPSEARHKGNAESQAAHSRVLLGKPETYRRIIQFVKSRGSQGATVHEIANALGYGPAINKVSGRLSELKTMNRLRKTGTRNNAAVLVVSE